MNVERPARRTSQDRVLKNAMGLVVAQVVSIPLSILLNGFMARYLGPSQFGDIYVATTFAAFAFLIVEWGQTATLPVLVIADRKAAGSILGTALLWRTCGAIAVTAILTIVTEMLGYSRNFQMVLALVLLTSFVANLLSACQSVIVGFERTDIAAYTQVLQQIVMSALVIPALLLGVQLKGVLSVQAAGTLVLLLFVMRMTQPVGVGRLQWDTGIARNIWSQGPAFLVFGLAVTLQSNVDAAFISKLVPPEVVGWYAASRKLVGSLIFPANALASALYPTLARLARENMDEFKAVTADAIETTTLLVVPVALCCVLYPDIGVRIFSRESFAPAEQVLQVSSIFVFLLFFSLVLSAALMAIGRQRAWAITQSGCVVVSLALDPLLIPWFQSRTGNGGLGLAIALVVSESFMVAVGVYLMPSGIFTRTLLRRLVLVISSGAAMALVAKLLGDVNSFIAAPLGVLVYFCALTASGGLDRKKAQALKTMFSRKFSP